MNRLLTIVTLAASSLTLVLGGCSSTQTRTEALPAEVRTAVTIFDKQGNETDWDTMLSAALNADVVVIGESHGHPLGLAAAATLFDDIIASGADTALLLEFIERDQQLAIDDYLAGVTSDKAFRKASRRTDGNYPPGHARMVEAAKAARRPVYAANAPRRYVRMTTKDGYEKLRALNPRQQALFTVPEPMLEGDYKENFFGLMGGMSHGTPETENGIPPEMIEKMYRSQQMWDATMADSVVTAARSGNRPAVLVVGRFHSDNTGGTVQLINRYAPGLKVVTLSMVTTDDATIDDDEIGQADFVLHVGE
jgi:uncharacterized iron-regulated protein